MKTVGISKLINLGLGIRKLWGEEKFLRIERYSDTVGILVDEKMFEEMHDAWAREYRQPPLTTNS